MTRPRCSSRTLGLLVVEHRTGGLGKRGACVRRSSALRKWPAFRHLRFATPARPALHDSQDGVLSHCLGPSHDRARLTSVLSGQTRTMLVAGGVNR
jgi:hypothetical protein